MVFQDYLLFPHLTVGENVAFPLRERGGLAPKPRGGRRHAKLDPHRVYLLRRVAEKDDITMPELAAVLAQAKRVDVDPSTLLHSHRLRLQL